MQAMSRDTDVFRKHHYNLHSQGAHTAEMCTFECLAKCRMPIRSWGQPVAHECGSAPREAHLLHRSCPWFSLELLLGPKPAEHGEMPTSHLPFCSSQWHWLEIKLWNGFKTEQQKVRTCLLYRVVIYVLQQGNKIGENCLFSRQVTLQSNFALLLESHKWSQGVWNSRKSSSGCFV